MLSNNVHEFIRIEIGSSKSEYLLSMLCQYLKGLRSPLTTDKIKFKYIELTTNNHMIMGSNMSYDNNNSGNNESDSERYINAIINVVSDIITEKSDDETICLRTAYNLDEPSGTGSQISFWKDFIENFGSDEIKDVLVYSSVIIPDNFSYNDYYPKHENPCDDILLYEYPDEGYQNKVFSEDECLSDFNYSWSTGDFSFDDYDNCYSWLAENGKWLDEILAKWKSVFSRYGFGIDNYSMKDEDEESGFIFHAFSLTGGKITRKNIKEFLSDYNEFIKDLRSKHIGTDTIDGNPCRYLLGELNGSFAVIVLDDSDPTYDGVKVKYASIV